MNDKEQLYYIEHKWLPWIFYGAGKGFVEGTLKEGSQMFIDLLTAMNTDEDAEEATDYICPYAAEEFQIRYFLYPDIHTTLVQLQMPKPQDMLFCRHIYLAMNTETKDRFLYTVERSQIGGYLLCGWEDDRSHMIFHMDVGESPKEDLPKILSLFAHHSEDKVKMKELIKSIRQQK